jgi:(methylthio)acryloyl-CoA hydratase
MAGAATDQLVTYGLQGQVAVIALNRPDKRNAVIDRMVEALAEAVARAESEARAAVIFGHGPRFSAGLDLAEHVVKTSMEAVRGSRRWHAVFAGTERGSIPYVAALHGAVVGGGLELAAAAHVRVADATDFFALPEGQRGIFVGGGLVRVARLMGAARMAEMMLTGTGGRRRGSRTLGRRPVPYPGGGRARRRWRWLRCRRSRAAPSPHRSWGWRSLASRRSRTRSRPA